MISILISVAVIIIFVYAFMQQKIFGKNPVVKPGDKISLSRHYKNGVFHNLSATSVLRKEFSIPGMMKAYLNKPKDNKPLKTIPFVKTNLHALDDSEPVIVWFGHSSYLISFNGVRILVDPVFSGNASPFSFSIKAFPGSNVYTAEDMPAIDVLLLTHDHYDHLDYKTIVALQPKVKHICTSLGVASHLSYWNIDATKITELDWEDSAVFPAGITLTAVPARHFSGRKMARAKTLWSSFILAWDGYKLYLGGDSGYDTHFKTIGEKYGPFHIALLECGQYGKDWPYIHMLPEETAKAAKELNAKMLLPVHWAKFSLSLHSWNEPIKRLLKAAADLQQPLTTPLIGEPVYLNKSSSIIEWWL